MDQRCQMSVSNIYRNVVTELDWNKDLKRKIKTFALWKQIVFRSRVKSFTRDGYPIVNLEFEPFQPNSGGKEKAVVCEQIDLINCVDNVFEFDF
ncbi:hypothetical protein TNCT_216421 [Trichonephila clavata]|uniref:Uncharacterized protein n=1 Tax=Trichonephila clavata TaxID=2740835 RepID=A0A8X6FNG2_TRICU|nr:hypothetical protein TNCT_216421 [Trichonephila clavata]